MIETLITLTVIGHLAILGILLYLEEGLIGGIGWKSSRLVEQIMSGLQTLTIGSCILFITIIITQ